MIASHIPVHHMLITIKDHSMSPLLRPDDQIEVEPGRPVPNGRVCYVKYGRRAKFRRVYQEGEYYLLKPLNPHWSNKAEYVHVEKAETYVISEVSRGWLKLRWREVTT
ncbi:S24 family peptidase [Candidatus Latescibacterota bacterium]